MDGRSSVTLLGQPKFVYAARATKPADGAKFCASQVPHTCSHSSSFLFSIPPRLLCTFSRILEAIDYAREISALSRVAAFLDMPSSIGRESPVERTSKHQHSSSENSKMLIPM